MKLLERETPLRELEAALKEAAAGEGRVALVSGEAGIGKTSLVEQFTRERRDAVRVLWGACDALYTPHPLGPLYDIANQTQGDLLALLTAEANRQTIISACLSELQRQPAMVVFEDVHWADEASLDLIKFLGRRIQRTASLLILTYRDDEIGAQHPLRLVFGDLLPSVTHRISLLPLTQGSVSALAHAANQDVHVSDLYAATGGNPFYVTEVLASAGMSVPATEAAGYGLFHGCVSGPQEGSMGVHLVNGDLVGDGMLDPMQPEALLYNFKDGQLSLTGVEYVVIAEAWDAANEMPPVMLGQVFNYVGSPNRYKIPAFYELHVWAWERNPNGTFADWNPRVTCDSYTGEPMHDHSSP